MNEAAKVFLAFLCCGILFSLSAENVQIISKGIPGKTLMSVNETWLNTVMTDQPDLVVMLYGTNDACNSKSLASPEEYEAKLKTVVRRICGESKLVLVTIPPCNETYLFKRHKTSAYGTMSPNERIRKLNAVLEKTAKENKIPIADFYSVALKQGCEGKESYLRLPETCGVPDGIHLTDTGYEALAETVLETIRKAGYTPKRILCIGDSLTYGIGTKTAGTTSGNTYPGILRQQINNTKER